MHVGGVVLLVALMCVRVLGEGLASRSMGVLSHALFAGGCPTSCGCACSSPVATEVTYDCSGRKLPAIPPCVTLDATTMYDAVL